MGPRSSGLLALPIMGLILILVNPTVGEIIISPQQIIRPNTTGSDLSESADSSGQPSITSVHQVWTSTSSGRLDELSPEMIGKLRNDVPFLAAYALRPRLVGAITSNPSGAIQPLESYISSQVQQPPTVGSSQRQDLIAKLGDFSELNVETSSLSKSEHHHKRKTSLKRKKAHDDNTDKELKLKRRVLETTNKLIKGTKGGSKISKTKVLRPMARAGRLRRKLDRRNLQHHMNIIKHGRYQQSTTGDNNGDDGVKGGGGGKKKTPFYSRADGRRISKDEERSEGTNGRDNDSSNSQDNDDADMSTIDGDDGELEPPQPRRVGDDDVDEVEGDTVMVMPKFDGVDDDPELPESLPEDGASATGGDDERMVNDSNVSEEEGNTRGRRVNRERPNGGDGDGGSQVLGGGIGATTGGSSSGDGATIASGASDDSDDVAGGSSTGGKVPSNVQPGVEFAKDDKESGDESSSAPVGRNANEDNEDAEQDGADGGESRGASDIERKNPKGEATSSDSDEADDEDSRESTPGKKQRKDGQKDLDYRDDDASSNKDAASKNHKVDDGGRMKAMTDEQDENRSHRKDCDDDGSYSHDDDHHHHHHHNSIKWLEDAVAGKPGYDYPILSRANATNFNCRDQKHPGYYADVDARCQVFHICQADGRQDSFLCPNGTIFSQKTTVCVWWNSFDCEDAPKYYDLNALLYKMAPQSAVAEDGDVVMNDLKPRDLPPRPRSRKEGSNDEDADEEPSIDGLIKAMKRRNQNGGGVIETMQMVPDGGRTGLDASGSDGAAQESDAKQPKTTPSATMDMIEPNDDEATTIQRKTPASAIKAANEQEEGAADFNEREGSSRLRRLSKSKAEPRKRRRRASVRQSPPKLTSRRYSRVSRRWKLRHAPKPKRRA